MIADLHLHYPMRVVRDLSPATTDQQVRKMAGHLSFGERAEALFIGLLGKFLNDREPDSGYRVTVEGLEEGDVGVVLSVLYRPLEEMDLSKAYGSPPDEGYFPLLLRDLERVEQEVGSHDAGLIRVVHDLAELDAARAEGAIAVVHCVEGGFHLGDTPEHVDRPTSPSWRGAVSPTSRSPTSSTVALPTNAPALPFLEDRRELRQSSSRSRQALGSRSWGGPRLRAMVADGILHRPVRRIRELRHGPPRKFRVIDPIIFIDRCPVIASHAGYRFGEQDQMLDDATLDRRFRGRATAWSG